MINDVKMMDNYRVSQMHVRMRGIYSVLNSTVHLYSSKRDKWKLYNEKIVYHGVIINETVEWY